MQEFNTNTDSRPASELEAKALFRADTDQHGDWYVWRRLGQNGWATMCRCDDRGAAENKAQSLNTGSITTRSGDTSFGG
ncbi:MAG: hypothetical protein Q9O74_08630 [Planctomycetota bacterium]|nr:hypothetical protein [Planctomycetota bacterium]